MKLPQPHHTDPAFGEGKTVIDMEAFDKYLDDIPRPPDVYSDTGFSLTGLTSTASYCIDVTREAVLDDVNAIVGEVQLEQTITRTLKSVARLFKPPRKTSRRSKPPKMPKIRSRSQPSLVVEVVPDEQEAVATSPEENVDE